MSRWNPHDKYGIGGDDFKATTWPPRRRRTPAEARAAYGAAEAAAYAQNVGNEAGETVGRERGDRFDALGNDLDDPLDPEDHEDYDDECWASQADLADAPLGFDPTAPCDFDSSSPRDLF